MLPNLFLALLPKYCLSTYFQQVTGVAYLHIDRGRGVTADLILIKLRAAVLASEAMVVATKDSKPSEKTTIGPVVEAAPFQKVMGKWVV